MPYASGVEAASDGHATSSTLMTHLNAPLEAAVPRVTLRSAFAHAYDSCHGRCRAHLLRAEARHARGNHGQAAPE